MSEEHDDYEELDALDFLDEPEWNSIYEQEQEIVEEDGHSLNSERSLFSRPINIPEFKTQEDTDDDNSDEEALKRDPNRETKVDLVKVANGETCINVNSNGLIEILDAEEVPSKLKRELVNQKEFAKEFLLGKVPLLQMWADIMTFAAQELGMKVDRKFVDFNYTRKQRALEKAIDLFTSERSQPPVGRTKRRRLSESE
jgi:hypothetical protein